MLTSCQNRHQEALITQTFPVDGQEVGAYGYIGVTFSQAMNPESVERAFSLSPSTKGEIIWQENNFFYRPIQALQRTSTYQALLKGNLSTVDGQIISVDLSWTFTVREPDLLYFVPTGALGEVWRSSSDGSHSQQLSQTDGNVLDFAPNRSGDQIIFSVQNENGGRDLWLMDRDGKNIHLFINCEMDFCDEPTWSMDQTYIAYTRASYTPETGGYQPPEVWTASVLTAETSPVLEGEAVLGHSPSFSPDGKHLAFYATVQEGIRILDLNNLQNILIPCTIPSSGDWSPDGSKLIFTNNVSAQHEPFVEVNILDIDTHQVSTAFNDVVTDTEFSQPRWSPTDDWIAVSLRPVNCNISKALWVLRINNTESLLIADEPSATFSSYRWDPWGSRLIFQRSALNSANPQIAIWEWLWETQESALVIEYGGRAEWLP